MAPVFATYGASQWRAEGRGAEGRRMTLLQVGVSITVVRC